MEHTPGPWTVANESHSHKRGLQSVVPIFANHADSGYKLPAEAYADDHETALANARLIAAAPELLEAIQGLVRCMDGDTTGRWKNCQDLTAARDAIAKAVPQ